MLKSNCFRTSCYGSIRIPAAQCALYEGFGAGCCVAEMKLKIKGLIVMMADFQLRVRNRADILNWENQKHFNSRQDKSKDLIHFSNFFVVTLFWRIHLCLFTGWHEKNHMCYYASCARTVFEASEKVEQLKQQRAGFGFDLTQCSSRKASQTDHRIRIACWPTFSQIQVSSVI